MAELQGGRQRTLLALLALQPGQWITAERLATGLWDDPPRTAVRTLQSHLTRLKQALTAAALPDALATSACGYKYALPASSVDSIQFASYVRAAQDLLDAGHHDRAVADLQRGLALWHGQPLQDAEPYGWAVNEVERLHELRLNALDLLYAGQLELGASTALIHDLHQHLRANPLREHSTGLLMRALQQRGRNADALAVYQRLRENLAEELGADPSPPLQELHLSLLRGEVPAQPAATVAIAKPAAVPQLPVPAELPAQVGHFTGRTADLAALHRMVTDPVVAAEAHVALICGPGGMGKTSLAIEWAHQMADRFPDGQIFLDAHGHEPELAASPSDVISHVLRALGVPADRVPHEAQEQRTLFRTLIKPRRVLIVLDNAGSAEQITQLIPGGGDSLLLCTSRQDLPRLDLQQVVHRVRLDVLNTVDSLTLLGHVLGSDRVAAESGSAAELVKLCDGMPLALRIAAAKLAARPQLSLQNFAAELTAGDRLDSLSFPGEPDGLQALFNSAYRSLSAPAARLFRLLGLHPGVTFSGELAATLAGTPSEPLLAELTAVHLATEFAPRRHRFHDLIKWYAGQLCQHEDADSERAATVAQIVNWYLSLSYAANRTLTPGRNRADEDPPRDLPEPPFPDEHEPVLTFLDAERGNLPPVAELALSTGDLDAAWRFSYLLSGYYYHRGHWHELVELCGISLTAAARLDTPTVEGLLHITAAMAYMRLRRIDDAIGGLLYAAEVMHAAGDSLCEGIAYGNLAHAYSLKRDFPAAIASCEHALRTHDANLSPLAISQSLNNLGDAYTKMGRPDLALLPLGQALEHVTASDNAHTEAAIRETLGQANLRIGRAATAAQHCRSALDLHRHIGDQWGEIETLNTLAKALTDLGNHGAAETVLGEALGICRDISARHLESITLANLGVVRLRAHAADEAAEHLRLALAIRVGAPDAYEEARIHQYLGDLAIKLQRPGEAKEHHERASDLYRKADAAAEADELSQLERW